jgi:hypothetical protein
MPQPVTSCPCAVRRTRWAVGVSFLFLAGLGALPPQRGLPAAPQDRTADSLVGLWIDSVGGMDTYHGFRSAAFTVTTVLHDTASGRIRRSRPRYVWVKKGPHGEEARIERWEAAGLIQQGFNGRVTWAALEGELLPDSAKDAREALYVARDVFYWFGLPFKLRDPGVYLSYLGLKQRSGAAWEGEDEPARQYHAVGVSFGEGVGEHQDVFTYYFPPGAGFPYEVTYVEEGRTELNRLIWGPTARAGDITYPFVEHRTWITESGRPSKVLVISDVVMNPEIPQQRFEAP